MFRLREVDISEIPEHIIAGVKIIKPNGPNEEGLTSEDWEACSEDGVWILQCSQDVNVSELLTGKKLRLNGSSTLTTGDDEDDANLTQYVPGSSLGSNIKDRQYEAISVPNENCNQGVILLLPDENRFNIVSAPVQGHIIVRESIKDLQDLTIEPERPKPRELPAGIKERHPVYGADFTSILKEMEAAKVKSPKKKKRKSGGEQEHYQYASQNGISFHYGGSPIIIDSEQSDSGVRTKKKKQKKHYEDEDNDVSIQARSNGFSVPRRLVDFSTPADFEDNVASSPKKGKKSKKRKREELESLDDFESSEQVNEIVELEPPVKKKKKSKSRYFD